MKKKSNTYLLPLLTLLVFMGISQNLKADGVCARQALFSQNAANTICKDTCKSAGSQWNGQWLGNTNKTCPSLKVPSPNIYGSVCGCVNVCHCENNEQVGCNEGYNPLGANRCQSKCDCSAGRTCSPSGFCLGNPCADLCQSNYSACEQSCDLARDSSTCYTICAWTFKTCGDNCASKASSEEKEKEAQKKEESSTPKETHEESPTPKKTPDHEEESPAPKKTPDHEEHPSKS